MPNDLANRHRGTLGGKFTDTRIPAQVTVEIAADVADTATAQHLAWMLLNLIARQTHEIGEIDLALPTGIAPVVPLGPLAPAGDDLASVLRAGIESIHPGIFKPRGDTRSRVSVRVGPGPVRAADFSLTTTAQGWSGYAGREAAASIGDDANPIGAYVAACLCAGEIFKYIRGMLPTAGAYAQRLWLDAYQLRVSGDAPVVRTLPFPLNLPAAAIVGIGAVANGFLHTLYALPNASGELVLIDGDPEGVTETNLNRYVLFGRPHLSPRTPKASGAAAMFADLSIVAHPVDTSWEAWIATRHGRAPDVVISAVDNNVARHAIQDALPRLILGASTNEMRAQVNRYEVLGDGPCLRCRNPVEAAVGDDVVIATLRALDPEERAARAAQVGEDARTLELFLTDPLAHCGMIGGEALRKFASVADRVEWSVGFVSALAGVLLAAEYIKSSAGPPDPALDAQRNTFRFQFWRPESDLVNRITSTAPEDGCLCRTDAFRRAISTP